MYNCYVECEVLNPYLEYQNKNPIHPEKIQCPVMTDYLLNGLDIPNTTAPTIVPTVIPTQLPTRPPTPKPRRHSDMDLDDNSIYDYVSTAKANDSTHDSADKTSNGKKNKPASLTSTEVVLLFFAGLVFVAVLLFVFVKCGIAKKKSKKNYAKNVSQRDQIIGGRQPMLAHNDHHYDDHDEYCEKDALIASIASNDAL